MGVKKLIMKQTAPNIEYEVIKEIRQLGEGDSVWTIVLAISYGIILGKREERKKKATA